MKSQSLQRFLTFVWSRRQRLLKNWIVMVWFVPVFLASFSILQNQVLAAPYTEEVIEKPEEHDFVKPPSGEKKENFSITQPKGQVADEGDMDRRFDRTVYYYPYKNEMDVHAGVVLGLEDSSKDPDRINGLIGFSYVLPRTLSPKWEVGADLSTVGYGNFWLSRRTIYNEKSAMRPYYECGLMHKFVPDEKLASFSNWENYLLRGGVGVAIIDTPPRSYRLEIEAAVGTEDVLVMLTLGYVWGF